MDIQESLRAVAAAAKTYKDGSRITAENGEGAYESVHALLDLIGIAKRKGATPYEIERAFSGEIIGSSSDDV